VKKLAKIYKTDGTYNYDYLVSLHRHGTIHSWTLIARGQAVNHGAAYIILRDMERAGYGQLLPTRGDGCKLRLKRSIWSLI